MTVQPPPNDAIPTGISTAISTEISHGASTEVSIGELAKNASTHLSTIIRGEVELAKTELKDSVKSGSAGVVFFLIAGVLAALSLIFVFVSLAELIHWFGLWRWVSYAIIVGFFLLLAGVFVLLGVKKVKRVKAPQRTITTAKDTAAFLKHPTQA